jgi:hypothetical protein
VKYERAKWAVGSTKILYILAFMRKHESREFNWLLARWYLAFYFPFLCNSKAIPCRFPKISWMLSCMQFNMFYYFFFGGTGVWTQGNLTHFCRNEFNLNKYNSLERIWLLIISGLHLISHILSPGGIIFQSRNRKIYWLFDLNVYSAPPNTLLPKVNFSEEN